MSKQSIKIKSNLIKINTELQLKTDSGQLVSLLDKSNKYASVPESPNSGLKYVPKNTILKVVNIESSTGGYVVYFTTKYGTVELRKYVLSEMFSNNHIIKLN